MPYSYTNKKGQLYHLHKRGKLFFFSKNSSNSIEMPLGYTVVENRKTGLPMLKKK
jgi:hypothetical protein